MSGKTLPTSDRATDIARIVRGLFDVTTRLSQCIDIDTALEARGKLADLRARAESLDDPAFAASFEAALVLLLPGDPGLGTT